MNKQAAANKVKHIESSALFPPSTAVRCDLQECQPSRSRSAGSSLLTLTQKQKAAVATRPRKSNHRHVLPLPINASTFTNVLIIEAYICFYGQYTGRQWCSLFTSFNLNRSLHGHRHALPCRGVRFQFGRKLLSPIEYTLCTLTIETSD